MQFPRNNREPWAGFLDTEPKMTLSKPLNVVPRSLRLPQTREGKTQVEGGGGETSYFPGPPFCTRESGQTARPFGPARVSPAAAADPPHFPSPSFREARQARSGPEWPGAVGLGEEGRGAPGWHPFILTRAGIPDPGVASVCLRAG